MSRVIPLALCAWVLACFVLFYLSLQAGAGAFRTLEAHTIEAASSRLEALWLEVHDAMDLSSLWQMRRLAAIDDRAVDQVGWLAAERPGNVVLIWEGGHASWRKAGYYFPNLPVIALGPERLRPGSPLVAAKFLGPGPGELIKGTSPLQIRLPAGARLLWMIDPKGVSFSRLQQRFQLRRADPVYHHDLPEETGEAELGAYTLVWQAGAALTADRLD